MNLDEAAKRLGYVDADHVERNIEAYGEPLPQWWEVIKELVNKLPLDDVIKQSEQLNFDCEWCEDTGVMITGMDCTCDKAPSKI